MRRRPSDGWIAGVCAGIAARLGVAPLLVRIIVLLGMCTAPTLVGFGYLAAWCLLDTERRRWSDWDH